MAKPELSHEPSLLLPEPQGQGSTLLGGRGVNQLPWHPCTEGSETRAALIHAPPFPTILHGPGAPAPRHS